MDDVVTHLPRRGSLSPNPHRSLIIVPVTGVRCCGRRLVPFKACSILGTSVLGACRPLRLCRPLPTGGFTLIK